MHHTPVSSSNLDSVGYDPDTQTLEVSFKSGGLYSYAGVPQSVYDGLMAADSHGGYFWANIRDQYPTTKLG